MVILKLLAVVLIFPLRLNTVIYSALQRTQTLLFLVALPTLKTESFSLTKIDSIITPALTIDGQDLHLHAEIDQHSFRLTSNETDGATASPVIDLFSDSGSSAAGDHIGEIRFRSDNGNSLPKTFADITAKIADPVNNSGRRRDKFQRHRGWSPYRGNNVS